MGLIQELDKLMRLIKDAEIKISSIRINISQIDKEIEGLAPKIVELEHNLEFLKKADTIPLAQEFKKTKSELSKTKTRLSLISIERGKAYQATLDIEKIMERYKKDQAVLIIGSENNILKGNFGGSRGKRRP